jgi:hypothetical protein
MWTSRVISLSRSRWSEFPITHTVEDLSEEFSLEIETEHLGLNQVPDRNQRRHDIMLRLAEKRYTGGEIASYLNKRGYKTPQGKEYYAKLVGATLSKIRRREQRRQKCTYKGSEITYWLRQR